MQNIVVSIVSHRNDNLKYTFTASIDPGTGVIVPLYNPRKDDWHNHFRWNETYTIIIGISPTGRATIKRLQLNRESLINLRQILRPLGYHPPF